MKGKPSRPVGGLEEILKGCGLTAVFTDADCEILWTYALSRMLTVLNAENRFSPEQKRPLVFGIVPRIASEVRETFERTLRPAELWVHYPDTQEAVRREPPHSFASLINTDPPRFYEKLRMIPDRCVEFIIERPPVFSSTRSFRRKSATAGWRRAVVCVYGGEKNGCGSRTRTVAQCGLDKLVEIRKCSAL